MPFDNGRFTLLAVLAYLAAQSLSPFRGGGVRAVAVHHQFKATQRNQFARHKTEEMADYDTVSLLHNQALFSLPWSGKGDRPSKQVTRSGKKRSIATSNAHVAKHTDNHRRQAPPQWIRTPRNGTLFNNTVSTSSSPDGMPGIVAIFSNNQILAYLFLVEQQNGPPVFDASEKNATEVTLMSVPKASSSDASASETDTYYSVMVSVRRNDGLYCASYDQSPSSPEPLVAEQCGAGTASQIFMYNSSSGVILPTRSEAQTKDVDTLYASSSTSPSVVSSASMGAGDAGLATSTDSALPSASSTSRSRRGGSDSYNAQNVTLVFVPNGTNSNAALAAVQEASTSTVTQTEVVYSSSASLSASAVNVTDATPSPALVASGSSSASMAQVTGLSVEVVGNGLFSAPAAVSRVVSTATPGSQVPSSSPAASSSVNSSMVVVAVAASYSPSSASGVSTTPSQESVAVVTGITSFSSSDTSAAASISSASGFPSAMAVLERNAAVTPVSTEPYQWRFRAEVI